MPFTLTMPKLSPTMEEGTLVKWHKKVGDSVQAGDLLIEVATDKATVEYNALDEGWVRQILVQEGEDAVVNQSIAVLTSDPNESLEGYQPQDVAKLQEEKKDVEEVPQAAKAQDEEPKRKGAVLQQPSFTPEPALENYVFQFPTERLEKRLLASPLAKKLAKEKGLDLSTVKGSGPNKRIMSRDLEKAQPANTVAFGHRENPSLPPGTYEELPLTPMRKVIGQRLQESKSFIPHFYVSLQIDAEPLVAVREQLKNGQIKVSVNDLVVRASALALRQHPAINCGFNSVNQSIIQFKTIDIAIAVSLESGLITPIVRHADFKNLGEISTEVRSLAQKARDGKLDPQEYKGGSFTISNLGMFGVSEFQAILNPPQAAILAVSGIQDVPVVRNGSVVPGKIMTLTLSVDHRVIDGVASAKFLQALKQLLENPALLLV
ncbi:dihydrolipoamide acetyltransferase [Candidatus Protochlamydia naegleriophila]|uniref:Acetyltransferase component of pyruvate dehydrogenase complex n=1 Tax=Candidatus Protochlamydia naegleriophila TaxID=389348 RepID=A0A0U5K343_9BACT|nr:pyruvate dehydrogenase complex dihydrolipoamide acetyltransferase [Candidatus Protochlamydia naegleriophila]CUI16523.1 dihydrolipoamide acetyltransferase [Candidatus Protochlamydia naegleriophila]